MYRRIDGALACGLVLTVGLGVSLPARGQGGTERVSVAENRDQADDESAAPALSADGRFVAFASYADNLVPDDTNNAADVFVHDRRTGATQRVSVATSGIQGDSGSWAPALSADGRYVAFESWSGNLVRGDASETRDVFVRDRRTGVTKRMSVRPNGGSSNIFEYSANPTLSANGRFVAFESSAEDLVPNDTNLQWDVFVRDRRRGRTERVSVATNGVQGDFGSFAAALSAGGRFVAFESLAGNLVSGDTNAAVDVFVHDRKTGKTERVSVATNGAQGNGWSQAPSLSAAGRFVVFHSEAGTLVPDDTNNRQDVFIHDRRTLSTKRVSVATNGAEGNGYSVDPTISADGRYVAFLSSASNLVPGDTNGRSDVFVHDRWRHTTDRVSVATNGAQGDDESVDPALSADGRVAAFTSYASNLVPGDTNEVGDVFVRVRTDAR